MAFGCFRCIFGLFLTMPKQHGRKSSHLAFQKAPKSTDVGPKVTPALTKSPPDLKKLQMSDPFRSFSDHLKSNYPFRPHVSFIFPSTFPFVFLSCPLMFLLAFCFVSCFFQTVTLFLIRMHFIFLSFPLFSFHLPFISFCVPFILLIFL